MGRPSGLAASSLALTILIASCAVLLGFLLWRERRIRPPHLAVVDHNHFRLQDLRRLSGVVLMAMLAIGIYVGSRMPHLVAVPGGRATETHPNRAFLVVWLAIFASVAILLGLAVLDVIATRRYARRHRQQMIEERLEILRETMRHAQEGDDGPPIPPDRS